jgi:2-amino-4-hydroxy-6-hydroxymethyldihydropteridine diphosphokinase
MRGIFIALGSNLGERERNLQRAQHELIDAGIEIIHTSHSIETPALLPENAPDAWNIPFLNQVIEVRTTHTPEALLAECKRIELKMGREAAARWAPRMIDLDVVSMNDLCVTSEALTLPHPQMHCRAFVLLPLQEIAPDWVHPLLQQPIAALVRAL